MKIFRPKAGLIGVAVLAVLLAGCGPTGSTASPAAASTTAPVAATTDATPAADPIVTSVPAPTTAPPTTAPPTTAPPTTAPLTTGAAKPAGTKKPAAKPTTHKPAPKPTTKKPTPKPKPTTKAPTAFVHPGAFCAPEGKIGYTSKGTRMRCTLKAGEDQPRWRAA